MFPFQRSSTGQRLRAEALGIDDDSTMDREGLFSATCEPGLSFLRLDCGFTLLDRLVSVLQRAVDFGAACLQLTGARVTDPVERLRDDTAKDGRSRQERDDLRRFHSPYLRGSKLYARISHQRT